MKATQTLGLYTAENQLLDPASLLVDNIYIEQCLIKKEQPQLMLLASAGEEPPSPSTPRPPAEALEAVLSQINPRGIEDTREALQNALYSTLGIGQVKLFDTFSLSLSLSLSLSALPFNFELLKNSSFKSNC